MQARIDLCRKRFDRMDVYLVRMEKGRAVMEKIKDATFHGSSIAGPSNTCAPLLTRSTASGARSPIRGNFAAWFIRGSNEIKPGGDGRFGGCTDVVSRISRAGRRDRSGAPDSLQRRAWQCQKRRVGMVSVRTFG